ncbi:protein C9orf135-like protein, partial [Huso huso]
HKNREAEPKNYDVTAHPTGEKDLQQSTYKHFPNALDAVGITSEYNLPSNKYCGIGRVVSVSLYSCGLLKQKSQSTCCYETCWPKTGFERVLPSHHPDHSKMSSNTYFYLYAIQYSLLYICMGGCGCVK